MDGLSGVPLCLHLAGICGVPIGTLSVADLWTMANGKRLSLREHAYHVAALLSGEVHVGIFLTTGQVGNANDLQLPEDFARKVAAHQEKCRQLGKFVMANGET